MIVQEMYPRRKKTPLKPENNLITKEFEEDPDNGQVAVQIDEILVAGEELFANGEYLEVIHHFNQAALTFQKYGFEIEAHIFYNKANELRSLVAERAGKLTLLEQAKICKNLTDILALYKDIMEISRKLNDFEGMKVFQSELHQIIMMNNNIQSNEIKQRSEVPGYPDNPIHLPKSVNFYENLQKFATEDLIIKRKRLEENAEKMEKWLLLKSAAIFYEKCEEVSLQLVHLGRAEEKINAEKYRNKKCDCLTKMSRAE